MQRRGFLGTVAAVLLVPLSGVFAQKPKGVVIPVIRYPDTKVVHLEVTTEIVVRKGDYLYREVDGLCWPVSHKNMSKMEYQERWDWLFNNTVGVACVTVGSPQQLQEDIDRVRKFYGRA